MSDYPSYGPLDGPVVIIGFGSIGRGTLPLILRHFDVKPDQITVVAPDNANAEILAMYGVRKLTALLTAVVAARRTGTDDKAAKLLEEALTSAEPHDMYRPFLDGGGAVHSAIALLISPSSPAAGFAARVHERFVCQPSSRAAGSGAAGHETPALTTSELAVLRLLRSYMSNQDIADTLFLSVNTVKTHLRSVYYKLGVSSRREAVERGVRLQIL